MRRRLPALALLLLACPVAAQTPPFGPEFVVNASTTANQALPAVAMAQEGNFVVAWQSDAGPYLGEDIFARRFDVFGAPLGGDIAVNTYVTDRQRHPDVATVGAGSFVVVWDSLNQEPPPSPGVFSFGGIYGQRFDAAGVAQGAEFHVNTTEAGNQFYPSASRNGSGDFVVAWTSPNGAYHQRYDFAGTPQGSEFQPPPGKTPGSPPDVAIDPAGNFVVVWSEGYDRDGSGFGIFAQVFDDAGLAKGPALQVNTYTTGDQAFPRVAIAGGGFVVVWSSSGQDGDGNGVFGRRFNLLGAPVGDEFLVTTATSGAQGYPDIASDFSNFVVVWQQPSGIFGQSFDSNGRRVGSEFPVSDGTSSSQGLAKAALSPSGTGNLVVAWTRADGDGDGAGVIGRRLETRMAAPMRVDEPAPGPSLRFPASSNGNGVLEPGETVSVEPSWTNRLQTGSPLAITATASALTGPPGGAYTLDDTSADYGSVGFGASADCRTATANCYQVTVSGSPRPATHWDASFREDLSIGFAKNWRLHVGGSFTDVPGTNPFYKKIETLLHNGITAGCAPTSYCPSDPVSRGQMSLFVARGIAGNPVAIPAQGSVGGNPYNCGAGGVSLFSDVAPTDVFCKSVHYIAARKVTLGCSATAYCPGETVTRRQMAAFVAKAIPPPPTAIVVPIAYGPDPVTGRSYSCEVGNSNTFFTDVPASDPFCKHVHFLWARGIIAGCGATLYCPDDAVTREAMAKFLSNAFALELYGP
ncbi:MAG: S-layer homology domain-containing protein [Acidobacteriota bacterium]